MQRMKLHLSGVKVPPLGSYKDKIYRDYLTKQGLKEVYKHKVLALSAIALSAGLQNAEAQARQVIEAFDNYSNMEMFLDRVKEELETTMREEYEFWKDSRPKINISKDGKPSLSVSTLIPKTEQPSKKPKQSKRKK